MKRYAIQADINGQWVALAVYATQEQAEQDKDTYGKSYAKPVRIVPIMK